MRQFATYFWKILITAFQSSLGKADTLAGFLSAIIVGVAKVTGLEGVATLDWWWLVLIAFGIVFAIRLFVLAPYWTYKDVKVGSDTTIEELRSKVVKQEWEYTRQHLINTRKPQLEPLPKLLRELLGQASGVVSSLELTDEANSAINEVVKVVEVQQKKYLLFDILSTETRKIINHCLSDNGIDVEDEIRTNEDCGRLLTQISESMDIGDRELISRIKVFYSSLFDGHATIFLIDNSLEFANKLGDSIKIRLIKVSILSSIETTLTEVNTRIKELLMGD